MNKAKLTQKKTNSYPGEVTLSAPWLCNGNVDNLYSTCDGTLSDNGVEEELIGIPDCKNNNCKDITTWDNLINNNPKVSVTKTRYAKISSSYAALYVPSDEIVADLTGMKMKKGDIQQLINITSPVKQFDDRYYKQGYHKIVKKVFVNDEMVEQNVYPIKLNAEQGAYSYTVNFGKFGEFYNNGALGRLFGTKNSVAADANITGFNGEYICSYVIDCNNCRVTGTPTDPTIIPGDVNPTPDIAIVYPTTGCKGCSIIWGSNGESGGLLPNIRQISLDDVNPSDRTLGYNLDNLKGTAAITEIEENGESIFKKPEYTVTLTPSVINDIRKYVNDKKKNNISSVNTSDDICDTYTNKKGYKNISDSKESALMEYNYLVCDSGLLDILAKNKNAKVEDNITYTSWLDSKYCQENNCAIGSGFGYGNIFGPAYK